MNVSSHVAKVCKLFVMLLVLATPGLFAAEECLARQGGEPSGEEAKLPLLFFEIPAAELRGDAATFELKAHVAGRLFLHERLTLEVPRDGTAPAVGLLAWHPDTLAELQRLAGGPGSRVRVALWLDGRVLRELSFEQLVRYNEALAKNGFHPVETKSELLVPSQELRIGRTLEKGDLACYERCGQEYDQCAAFCDPYGPHSGCEQCRTDLDTCQQWCNLCPTVKEWTETRLVAVIPTYLPAECLGWGSVNKPQKYHPVIARYSVTRYRRTANCDGTYTTTVLSVRYTEQPCYREMFPITYCTYPQGPAPACRIPYYVQ